MTTTETTETTAPRLDAARFLAYSRPEPLQEDFLVAEMGGTVRIEGIKGYQARQDLYAEMAGMKATKALLVVSPATKERFRPSDPDITAACWIAACVTEPALTSLQWLQFAGEGASILGEIYERVLVCSRVIPEPPKPEPPEEGESAADALPDGEAAAERELEADPLAPGGAASA